jgi:hypothetical protein
MRLALALFCYWLSIHWNAVGIFAPARFDAGDTGTHYPDWGAGRADHFGLTGEHFGRNWVDLWGDFPARRGHHMRSFVYSYVTDYPKRAGRVASVVFIALEVVAVVGWLT